MPRLIEIFALCAGRNGVGVSGEDGCLMDVRWWMGVAWGVCWGRCKGEIRLFLHVDDGDGMDFFPLRAFRVERGH